MTPKMSTPDQTFSGLLPSWLQEASGRPPDPQNHEKLLNNNNSLLLFFMILGTFSDTVPAVVACSVAGFWA